MKSLILGCIASLLFLCGCAKIADSIPFEVAQAADPPISWSERGEHWAGVTIPFYGTGESSWFYGLDIGLFEDRSRVYRVKGVGIGLFWSAPREVSGFQLGGTVAMADESRGLQMGLITAIAGCQGRKDFGYCYGVQFAPAFCYAQTYAGAQVSFFNCAENLSGVQFGLFNYAMEMHGVQIGLLNYKEGCPYPIPLLRLHFGDDDPAETKSEPVEMEKAP